MTGRAKWTGRTLSVVGLLAWAGWLGWRVSTSMSGLTSLGGLLLELAAFAAALVVTAGLWNSAMARTRIQSSSQSASDKHRRLLPRVMADALGLDESFVEDSAQSSTVGVDDTGEVAWARQGLVLLSAAARRDSSSTRAVPTMSEAAWSVVAIDGLRRMLFVVFIVAVLLSGQFPFGIPPIEIGALLVGGLASLSLGHWLLSGRLLRPGARATWSMASVGAGLGDGISRSGLPIRWMATMATMVVLNLAVSLRGLSDRWTHGLGSMSHDERVMAMSTAFGFVMIGFLALRTLPQPEIGFYGATRRIEEGSARRLALGATLGIALLGFVVGVLPGGAPA